MWLRIDEYHKSKEKIFLLNIPHYLQYAWKRKNKLIYTAKSSDVMQDNTAHENICGIKWFISDPSHL